MAGAGTAVAVAKAVRAVTANIGCALWRFVGGCGVLGVGAVGRFDVRVNCDIGRSVGRRISDRSDGNITRPVDDGGVCTLVSGRIVSGICRRSAARKAHGHSGQDSDREN